MNQQTKLDLATINELGPILERAIKNRVCELETQHQQAIDHEYYSWADQIRHASREVDLLRHTITGALNDVFLDELERQEFARSSRRARAHATEVEVMKTPEPVELPALPAKTRTVDV